MTAGSSPGELLEQVEQLSARVDELADPEARELAQALVSAVIAMYGDGLERIVTAIGEAREAGTAIMDALAQDGAVSSLLLIHDLYPVPLQERVIEALDTVRPYMESHGGNVELLGIEEGVARLALQGSCDGCAASRATLELAIKQALDEHAPDLAGLEVAGVTPEPAPAFELPMVHVGNGAQLPMSGSAHWVELDGEAQLESSGLRGIEVEGIPLVLASVNGALLAYRNACAACGEPVHEGVLRGGMLSCPACGVEFDLPRAGRAAGNEPLQLTPVPLLRGEGVRVAL